MLLPILFLGAAALLLANRSKVKALYRSKIDEGDIKSYGSASYGALVEAVPSVLNEQGVAKVRAKLERQQTDLSDPLAILTLANLEQAFFYGLSAGSDKPATPSAHGDVCDSLAGLSSEYGSDPVLFVSPRNLEQGGVQWLGGFVVTTGEPSSADFAPGGALEGCIRVGDYESLKSAKFC